MKFAAIVLSVVGLLAPTPASAEKLLQSFAITVYGGAWDAIECGVGIAVAGVGVSCIVASATSMGLNWSAVL